MLNANSKIIFISCIDKKRSIKDIATEWDYKYESGKLYHGNSQEELLKNKFVIKEKSGKYVYYKADIKKFGKYITKIIDDIKEEDEIENNLKTVITDNHDEFLELLQEEFVISNVFSIKNIKKLYNNDRTFIPDNFDQCFLGAYLSLVVFFIVDGQKNKDRLLNIFNTLLLPEFGCKINMKEFMNENIKIFEKNRDALQKYKILYDEYQEQL
ncbi:MAG: hypothetical protein V1718_03900 [archaeon]